MATARKSNSARGHSSAGSSKSSGSQRKYSPKAESKVADVMHEYKRGELKSGGRSKVKSRKQAIAIGISEARKAGAKVPPKKTA
jgi:hypothetical protein